MKAENTKSSRATVNGYALDGVGIVATVREGNMATEKIQYSLAVKLEKENGRYKVMPLAQALKGTSDIGHDLKEYTGDTYTQPVALLKAEKLATAWKIPLLDKEAELLAEVKKEIESGALDEKGRAVKKDKGDKDKKAQTLTEKIGAAVSSDKKATNNEKICALVACLDAYDRPLACVLRLAIASGDTLTGLVKYAGEAVEMRTKTEEEKAEAKRKAAAEEEEKRRAALAAAVGMKVAAKKEMAAEEREAAALAIKNAERLEKEAAALAK